MTNKKNISTISKVYRLSTGNVKVHYFTVTREQTLKCASLYHSNGTNLKISVEMSTSTTKFQVTWLFQICTRIAFATMYLTDMNTLVMELIEQSRGSDSRPYSMRRSRFKLKYFILCNLFQAADNEERPGTHHSTSQLDVYFCILTILRGE